MKVLNSIKHWLPLALAITFLCGVIYVSLQQNLRISANDPQIQLAEDISSELSNGQNPQFFIPSRKIDISKSLSNFILIYDKNGKLIGSSALLDGIAPIVPSGVFATTQKKGQTRFTWQPKTGVREALVVNYYKGKSQGFVAVGRSLKEVEIREDQLLFNVFLGLVVTLITSLISFLFIEKINSKRHSS